MTWPIRIDPVFKCWEWSAKRDLQGYGLVYRGPGPVKAYLVVWEAERGEVPTGHVLDHLCRNRACVNPNHLEPVKKEDNERRKSWARRVSRGTCAKGHDMSNAITTRWGGRLCRTCHKDGE